MRKHSQKGPFVPASILTLFIALAGAGSVLGQGQNIGSNVGRSGLWPLLATPPGNPFQSAVGNDYAPAPGSATQLKVMLGKALFWDEQVSVDNTVACGTCHAMEVAGVDPRGSALAPNNGFGSQGVVPQDSLKFFTTGTPLNAQQNVTGILAPTMLGAAFAERLFWDVRSGPNFTLESGAPIVDVNGVDQFPLNAALEDQAVDPPLSPVEMAHAGLTWGSGQLKTKLDPSRILALATFSTVPLDLQPFVAAGITYQVGFDVAFAGDPNFGGALGVTRERFALAIAAYERTLVPNQAPIDTRGLTVPELNGFTILAQSQCFRCHANQTTFFGTHTPSLTGTGGFVDAMDAMLTDNRRHGAIGFPSTPGAIPGSQADGNFNVKTPTLRNITLHPRLAHNGFFTTFAQIIQFYNRELPGLIPTFPFDGNPLVPGNQQLSTAQKADVVAFFQALVDPRLIPAFPGAQLPPPFDHPDLYAQRVPLGSNEPATHPGTPAVPGGPIPDIIAHSPLYNTTEFKVGVRNAPASSPAAIIGISPNALPIPAPPGPIMLNPAGLITVVTTTDASGFGTFFAGAFPPVLAGMPFSFQWGVVDPVSGAIAFSNAAELITQ